MTVVTKYKFSYKRHASAACTTTATLYDHLYVTLVNCVKASKNIVKFLLSGSQRFYFSHT